MGDRGEGHSIRSSLGPRSAGKLLVLDGGILAAWDARSPRWEDRAGEQRRKVVWRQETQDGLMVDGGTGKQSQMKRAAEAREIPPVLEQKGQRAQHGFLNCRTHGKLVEALDPERIPRTLNPGWARSGIWDQFLR